MKLKGRRAFHGRLAHYKARFSRVIVIRNDNANCHCELTIRDTIANCNIRNIIANITQM